MAKNHVDREPTYEPVDEPAEPVGTGLTAGPPAAQDDVTPKPARLRARPPRRPVARAQAGHAAGAGEASGA